MTDNYEHILTDACNVLSKDQGLSDTKTTHIENRHFSRIYEINGKRKEVDHRYILKISTTDRSCKNEYIQYNLLQQKNIRSLTPIYYSEKHNYLITKKEELIEFDRHLKSKNDQNYAAKMFYKLGMLFKNLDESTGHTDIFTSEIVKEYTNSRLNELSVFSTKRKKEIAQKIQQIADSKDGESTRYCLVSDYSLGNIHVANDNEFVLLDMGDASIGNAYDNIAYIFLNIKFGSLNQYMQNAKKTEAYFSNYLSGYGLQSFDEDLFNLFKIKHLLLMISFVSKYKTSSKNLTRMALSAASNKYLIYRYKNELYKLFGELR